MKRTFEQMNNKDKQHSLCIMNLDQYWDEKGLLKFLRKE